ncbi:hypothetical protein KF913_15070 [Candidatus Obscuribacterales bacterium]|nr:hypothetical protein [Candidatus Obscuribacterales bacterium]
MPKQKLQFALATVICAAALLNLPSFAVEEGAPPIPGKASKPAGFVTEPWVVDSEAVGDLNKDGRPDVAMILSIDAQGGMSAAHRKLIVALKRGNTFEKVLESDKTTMLGFGPSGGLPQVEIKKGVLIVHHYGGSRERYEYWHKYQIRDGRFVLIGFTAASNDALDPSSHQKVDVNTMTGEISSNCASSKGMVSERLLELWAAPIKGDEPSPSDWGAPAVHVKTVDEKGKVSATLQAVHSARKLFVKAQLDDETPLTSGEICLVDEKGRIIPPDSSRATIYGYRVNTYDLQSGLLKELISKDGSGDQHILRLSVTVKPHAASQSKLSTSIKKKTGAIFLSKTKGAPDLLEVDVRDGDPIHPFFTYGEI